jgi:hypothetical protein
MTQPLRITRPGQFWGIFVSSVLLALSSTTVVADDSVPADTPSVFQPNEIQHGFGEYDTPPDFFSDDVPAPYDEYAHSPTASPSDQKPGGLFLSLDFAESVEEDQAIRRGHVYLPVNPTDRFSPQIPSVYLVFSVHKVLASYQIIGRLFRETETGVDPAQWLDEDIVHLATEDESGFLKFFPPQGTWQPGQYRVDLYVGFMANPMNKMGAMRFTVRPPSAP